jgi:hypothetical protein
VNSENPAAKRKSSDQGDLVQLSVQGILLAFKRSSATSPRPHAKQRRTKLRLHRQPSPMREWLQCQCLINRSVRRLRCRVHRKMTSNHPRNTGPMLSSRRCGAKTRSGKPCMAPAVSGKTRCRMHGGAAGSGAPHGNKNALKHGHYTRQALAERRLVRQLIRQSWDLIQKTR